MRPGDVRVAVLVPVHDSLLSPAAAFLPRALESLRAQAAGAWEAGAWEAGAWEAGAWEAGAWEAVVVDDGSPRPGVVAEIVTAAGDPRIRLLRLEGNRGLGAALNAGLDATTAPVVAYLPADDVWSPGHLEALLGGLADPGVVRARSRLTEPADTAYDQLVQVAHRRTGDRWVERGELETDDLDRLMWRRLDAGGAVADTGVVTCAWTRHPGQRSRAIRTAFDGGLNVFRARYRVREPLRFSSTDGADVDEVDRYGRFRERSYEPAADGLRVLVVGELAFNPERVLALAARGHSLAGLWTATGLGDSTVGPLPFGHVADLGVVDPAALADPAAEWRRAVRDLAPDVVWGQLNWRSVPLAHAVRSAFPDVPFVFSFKEAPQRSIVRGEWPLLADLVTAADASLFCSEEERDWFALALSGRVDPARLGVLDGDLPLAEWLDAPRSPKLSDADGEPHAAVVGRPSGLDLDWVLRLAGRGVHTHLYGQQRAPGATGSWQGWLDEALARAPRFVHLHPPIGPGEWVPELSRYDAGWLHRFGSANGGDLRLATWDDLNSPARLPVCLAAGLPLLQQENRGSLVSVERVVRTEGTGLFYRSADDVADRLVEEVATRAAATAALAVRRRHTFDAHADRLVELFRSLAR